MKNSQRASATIRRAKDNFRPPVFAVFLAGSVVRNNGQLNLQRTKPFFRVLDNQVRAVHISGGLDIAGVGLELRLKFEAQILATDIGGSIKNLAHFNVGVFHHQRVSLHHCPDIYRTDFLCPHIAGKRGRERAVEAVFSPHFVGAAVGMRDAEKARLAALDGDKNRGIFQGHFFVCGAAKNLAPMGKKCKIRNYTTSSPRGPAQ